MRIRIQGDEWIAKFKTYITEVERQEKFAQLKVNVQTKLSALLTSAKKRSQDEWWTENHMILSYDGVTEEFGHKEEDIIEAIKQVGEDKNNLILNLSGCQSRACINTLSKILKERHDIEVLIIANCNIDEPTAHELLTIIQDTQLRFVDISGNNLSDDIVQAFQAIVERNRTQGFHSIIQEDGPEISEPLGLLAGNELAANATLSDSEANMQQEATSTSPKPRFYAEEFFMNPAKNGLDQL